MPFNSNKAISKNIKELIAAGHRVARNSATSAGGANTFVPDGKAKKAEKKKGAHDGDEFITIPGVPIF